jgi:hypothetical protein
MSSYDSHSTDGFSRGYNHSFGYSISDGVSPSFGEGVSVPSGESVSYRYTESISTSEDAAFGDAVRIARGIFTAEVADLITVLRNCGALRTRAESFWCIKELWRLLADRSQGDLT